MGRNHRVLAMARAHSIVEILVVIAIILILATLILWAAMKIRRVVKSLDGNAGPIERVEPWLDGPDAAGLERPRLV